MSKAPARTIRRTARVLLLDRDDRFLLFRYTFWSLKPFWFPPGGACEEGEDFAGAARRELFEETGILAQPEPLGLICEYDYTTPDGIHAHAVEHYFHHRTDVTTIDTASHTELERECMVEHRWFTLDDLPGWHETVYPAELAHLVTGLRERTV